MSIPKGAALIRGQCLFEAWHLLEEICYYTPTMSKIEGQLLHLFQYHLFRDIPFVFLKDIF